MKSLVIMVITAAAVLFGSCGLHLPGKNPVAAKGQGPLPDKDVKGAVLNVMLDTAIERIDQQKSTEGTSFEIIGDLVDGLMQMAADGSVVNAIAKKMDISPDGLIYTFTLRDDAYWSNGDPVTAHDFVYGWERACDPANEAEYSYLMSDIAHIKNAIAIRAGQMNPNQLGVQALDDYTLRVELEIPVSFFEQLLYFCTFYPSNQKFIEACGDNYGTSADTFLSNGAFILKDFKAGASSFSLIKNTAYYDASRIKLAGLHYEVIKSRSEALSKYEGGQLDLIEVAGEQVAKVRNSSEFKAIASGFLWYISPNMLVDDFKNVNLRRALMFALDREAVTNDVLADGSQPTYTPVPSGFAFNASGQDFTVDLMEFPQYCSYDPEAARRYYEEAKQELGKNTFTFTMVTDDTETVMAVARELKRQIETVLPGMTIELNHIRKSQRLAEIGAGNYEITLTRWGPDYADPMTYLSMWVTGNDYNYGRYSDVNYDAIVSNCNDGDLATKPAERWTAMKQAEEMILKNAVIFPLYQQCSADMIKPGVRDIEFHPIGINRIYKGTSK